jgi:menaquinone-dependent protoporphyrinogen oxidase
VLGSAVRVGQWLPEAVKFVEQHRPVLSQHPVALFAVHIMNLEDDDASRKARLAYLDPVRKLITPRAEAFFAGVGDLTKLNFVERMLGKMAKAPEGDFRDPQAIRAWGMSLYDLLV